MDRIQTSLESHLRHSISLMRHVYEVDFRRSEINLILGAICDRGIKLGLVSSVFSRLQLSRYTPARVVVSERKKFYRGRHGISNLCP